MKIVIKFDTNNAAFEDNFLMQVTKAIQQAKAAIIDSENNIDICRPIRDINGNRIGVVDISSN
jgi:putative methionine-R-sulfoxide reductase with GAF domain